MSDDPVERGLAAMRASLEAERAAGRCADPGCTRINGKCVGYHCPHCEKPCSSHGHDCPERTAA